MDHPNQTRRRRAVCAVLEGVLDDDELMAALWLAHDSLLGDAVTDIIRYVDAVAERHLIDPGTRKRLYDALYRALKRADAELPIDPWPAMLATRPVPAASPPARSNAAPPRWPAAAPPQGYGASAPGAFAPPYPASYPTGQAAAAPAYAPVYMPAYPPSFAPAPTQFAPGYGPGLGGLPSQPGASAPFGVAAPVQPASVVVPATAAVVAEAAAAADVGWTAESGIAAEQAVFADLVAHIATDIAQSHASDFDDWRSGWRSQLQSQKKLDAAVQERVQAACIALTPDQDLASLRKAWLLPLSAAQLASQVHHLYVVLCEALGPVTADQVLTRSVKRVEQTPAARLFSPRKLL